MNKYDLKVMRIENHLRAHPRDAQSVISLMKNKSNSFSYDIHKKKCERQKAVAEFRRAHEKRT